jgi:hypothetical protein
MKRRAVTILVALGLIALVAWVAGYTQFREVRIPAPLRGEAARNPFYAAIRLSEELGAEAVWERVFTAPAADAVILLSQWNWSLSRARRERIEQWVEAGGRLIVDGSLMGGIDEFAGWSGVSVKEPPEEPEPSEEEEEEEKEEAAPPQRRIPTARRNEPVCHKLNENGSTRQLVVCGLDTTRSLTASRKILWSLRDGDAIHALRTQVGRGTVTVINGSPFRHRDFLLGDHPRLFVTLTQLRQGDAVVFLTEQDQASLLALVWRFGAPAVLLLLSGVLLALWRASPRFGPPTAPTEAVRRSLAEQIRGTGQFALRFGSGESLHAATTRALRDAAIRRFPSYDRMSSAERVTVLARVSGVDAGDLAPALNFSGRRSSHELRQSIATLEAVRRRLLIHKVKHGN